MKRSNRFLALLLLVTLLLPFLPVMSGAEEDTTVSYEYVNTLRGDGEGVFTVSSPITGGYLHLYFKDSNGLLPGYEQIAKQAVTAPSTVFSLPEAFLLPPQATGIAVFHSEKNTLTDPDMNNAIAVYEIPQEKRLANAAPQFSFASVSDVHLNYDDNGYGASAKWTAALNFFDEMKMDSVIISGDLTSSGGVADYNRYKAAVEASSFDPARIYEAQGNHDSTQVARFLSYTQGEDDIHPFDGSAWFYVLKPGKNGGRDNLFIFMAQELSSTGATPTSDNFSSRQLDWVEELLQTYSGTETNIFLVEHSMIRNFGPGDKINGVYVEPMYFNDSFPGNMRLKTLLTTYKEIIMMSGHTHLSLREGYNFGDENGTAARMIHNSSTSQPRSYTASGSISYNSEGRTTATSGSEGYLVYVYEDAVTYVGYDLTARNAIPTASYLIPLYSENRKAAKKIEVTVLPDKTTYEAGECFDASSMVVTATYEDGSTAPVKGWSFTPIGSLHSTDKAVSVTYGDCAPVTVSVEVGAEPSKNGEGVLTGSGTKDDPYLVSNAEDFAFLTKCFNASTSSNDCCGTGCFYRQTADIDMTGFTGYEGTHANGNAKCYFGGIYDGGGHTLTVNISASKQTSVFPYINGVILNLKIGGSITSSESAQPVRTVQAGAVIAGCVFDMTLTSSNANGVCYTNYGTLLNVYASGIATHAVHSSNSGKYYHVFTNMKKASGSAITSSGATASDDLDAIAAVFNDRTDSAFAAGLSALSANCPGLGEKSLGEVRAEKGALLLSAGESCDASVLFAGTGTAEDPFLITIAEDFRKLTDLFNASTSSSAPYGTGLFFCQTADIDMTGVLNYEGTYANGNAKCYFGGIYNGGGHTLTVNITASGQTSVFPYITGAILNLKITGSISSDTSAQPIRTIQPGAVVANCIFDLVLTSSNANGVCYSNYGTVYNVFISGVAVHSTHSSNSGKYYNCYADVKNSSGATLSTSVAEITSDPEKICAGLSDRMSSPAQNGLTALSVFNAALTADILESFWIDNGILAFGRAPAGVLGDINKDGILTIADVTELLNILSGPNPGDSFDLNGDGIASIMDVTTLLNMLSTGENAQ